MNYYYHYEHYRGGFYTLITEGRREGDPNEERLVVYKSLAGITWVRPREEFYGTVTLNGKTVPRFTRRFNTHLFVIQGVTLCVLAAAAVLRKR